MKKDQQSVLTTAKPTKLRLEHLTSLEPITDNQRVVFDFFKKEYHMVLSGSAGSGKTFLSMALALEQVLNKESPFDKLIIVRSVVPTRDIGFLPGTKEEKEFEFELAFEREFYYKYEPKVELFGDIKRKI